MKRFRNKLTVIFLLLIGLSVIGLGWFTADHLKHSQIETMKEGMLREMSLIMATIAWKSDLDSDEAMRYFESHTQRINNHAVTRFTFIDAQGRVLADTDEEAGKMDNHLNRPEIQEAYHTGESGSSIRFSDTLQKDMLNVAIPVYDNQQLVGFLRTGLELKGVSEAVRGVWTYYIIGLLVLFILSGFISYGVARGLTKPLENMTRVARQITKSNDHSRVEINQKDEIGELAKAINTMAQSLQDQMRQIAENEGQLKTVLENLISGVVLIDRKQRIVLVNKAAEEIVGNSAEMMIGQTFNQAGIEQKEFLDMIWQGIEQKSPDSKEMVFHYPGERTLEINFVPLFQNKQSWAGAIVVLHDITEIRRLERMRSEFVANVSHELKTPIASIKGFTETLLTGTVKDTETTESFLQIIYDESERLNRLILDILQLSEIESKRAPLLFSPIELEEFIRKITHMLENEAARKDVQLEADVKPDTYIEADEDRLRQVLINLLSNGIQYSSRGSKVRVEVQTSQLSDDLAQEKIRIRVTDSGMGIPEKDLPRIFERFYRVDKARSRRSGGTGLGLSIVKHIVELHHGAIEVESQVGVGTSFIIELPVIQNQS